MTDYSVRRDYYDRPIVYPPGFDPKDDKGYWKEGVGRDGKQKRWWYTRQGKGYGRASGAGKGLDTKEGLIDWAACQAAVGILLDASARSEVATLINEYQGDPWYRGDDGGTRSGKQRLKAAVEQARNTAGQHTAASAGTEFHKLAELSNRGEQPRIVQEHLKEPLAKYQRAVEPVEFIDQEMLIVNDRLELCGSADYLIGLPAGIVTPDGVRHDKEMVVVGDLKGLPLDTKIPTPDGFTTMGELKVGDTVFGADGSQCKVRAKSAVKRIGTYIVKFDDGSQVVCDSEHLWWTVSGSWRDMREQVLPVGVIAGTIKNQHRVPVAGALKLPQATNLPVDPYLFGVWLGDGNKGRGVITKSDELFDLLASLGFKLGVRCADKRSGCPSRTVIGLQAALRSAGLLGEKRIPQQYLRAGYSQRLALLQGLMDTDGTWNICRNSAVFSTTDKDIAYAVDELLLTLGQRSRVSAYQASGFGKTVTAYSVEFTPVDLMPFRLPSKRDKCASGLGIKTSVERSRRRLIVAVEKGPDVPTVCIGVTSPHNTYLCTEKFIPTHNTGKWDADRPMSVTCQLTAYGTGEQYDQETNTRSPLHEMINQRWGVMVHFPIMAKEPEVKFYWVDLALGLEACLLAKQIDAMRSKFNAKDAKLKELDLSGYQW